MRCEKAIILTIILVGILLIMSPAHAQLESPSSPAGFIRYSFEEGWNAISLPFLQEDEDLEDVFTDDLSLECFLTGGATEEESDRVLVFDPEFGQWISAWIDEDGDWQGSLTSRDPRYDWVYWVQIREGHQRNDELLVRGLGCNEPMIDRGVYQPGMHFISPIWAGEFELRFSGLEEAGYSFDSILPQDPDEYTGEVSNYILEFDGNGWHRVAYSTSLLRIDKWDGNLNAFTPGKAYILVIHEPIDWYYYRRPDLAGPTATNATQSNSERPVRKAVSVTSYRVSDLPPLPEVQRHQTRNESSSPAQSIRERKEQ